MNLFSKLIILSTLAASPLSALAYDFDDDNLALLDVVYSRQNIGDGLDVYLNNESFYVPLVDLVSLLEVDINVTEAGASGRMPGENDEFSLEENDGRWQVTIGERKPLISHDSVYIYEGLLYVKKEDVEDWFGIGFELDFSNSNLMLEAPSTFPFAARVARNSRKIGAQYDFGPATLPEWQQPYKWAEIPSADVRLNYFSTRYENDNIKRKNVNNMLYSVRTIGDFAAMSTETFFSGVTDDGLNGASIRMDRYDNSREILNLGLSQISIGDVTNPALGFGNSASGRGLLFGNDVVEGGLSRDVRDIEGDYYPGWDVELYLNATLIGYQTIGDDGHYRFENVILFSGDNNFKLKFYGPNGQKDEQARRIVVGDDIKDLHKFRYSVALTQPNKKVIEIQDVQPNVDYQYQATFNSRYLLTKNFGVSFGMQQSGQRLLEEETAENDPTVDDLNVDDEMLVDPLAEDIEGEYQEFQYVSFGIQSYFAGLNLSYTTTQELNGASQHAVSLGGVLGTGMVYQFRAAEYDDEMDFGGVIYDESDNPQLNSYDLSLNQSFGSHSFILRGASRSYKLSNQFDGRFGYSGQFGWAGVSSVLEYQKEDLDDQEGQNVEEPENQINDDSLEVVALTEQLNGASFFSYSQRQMSIRLSAAYTIKPESELTSLGITSAWRIDDKINLDASVNQNLINDSMFYRLGLSWVTPAFRLSPAIAYSDTGYWQGQVQFSMSLGKRTGRLGNYYQMGSDPTLTNGAIRARLFEDRNRDGQYQLGETLLSGGEINAVQSRRKGRSNKAGIAWIESLPPWRLTDIQINDNSIDADYVALAVDDFSVMPRPGRTVELDLPFTLVGEIDGTVMEVAGEYSSEAKGVTVLLIGANDEIVDKDNSDSQGYFNFPRVKPGEYRLRVESRDIINMNPKKLVVESTGNYLSGVVLTINMPVVDDFFEGVIEPAPASAASIAAAPKAEPPVFTGISLPVVEQVVESEVSIAPIFNVPTVNTVVNEVEVKAEPVPDNEPEIAAEPENSPKANNDALMNDDLESLTNETFWSVQAGSFRSQESAGKLVSKIQKIGFSAKAETVELPKGRFYRVFAHGFIDESSALEAKSSLDSMLKISTIVKKM